MGIITSGVSRRRKKLKKALMQLHRACSMLENFATLNFTGFFKIVKSYDKTMGTNELEGYMEHCRTKEFYNHLGTIEVTGACEVSDSKRFLFHQ